MSADQYTEVSRQSWGSRLAGSLRGVVFGLLLLVLAVFILFWNEGRSVKRYKLIEEGAREAVSIPHAPVDIANDGKLVHVTGLATTDEVLADPDFGVQEAGLRLKRSVEMFQWQEQIKTETKSQAGGSAETITTYTYDKSWNDHVIDSSRFNKPAGHDNPEQMRFESKTFQAEHVTLGEFQLPGFLVERIYTFKPIPAHTNAITAALAVPASSDGWTLYLGDDANAPTVGDLKIQFGIVTPQEISIIARQVGRTFEPFIGRRGAELVLLELGEVTLREMIEHAHDANRKLTWGLRVVGFLVGLIGFVAILSPLQVLADVWPLLGRLVGAGVGVASGLLSAVLSCVTIGIAWMFYRPMYSICMIGLAIGLVVILARRSRIRD